MADAPAPATAPRPHGPVSAYAGELAALVGQLDPGAGWFAVFTAHDPEGLRECLEGREVPPWDVVASLLEDLERRRGAGAARQAAERLRPLHGAAVAAHDAGAGGVPVLRERLAALAGELETARARVRELEAYGGSVDAHWAREYVVRVEARCVELRERMGALESAAVPGAPRGHGAPSGPQERERPPERERAQERPHERTSEPEPPPEPRREPGPLESLPAAPPLAPPPAPAPPRTKRARRGGSRFAGAPEADDGTDAPRPIVPPGAPSPDLAPRDGTHPGSAASEAVPLPRGARFAGAVHEPAERTAAPSPEELAAARAAAADATARLSRLRNEGSGGAAHALLCEAAYWRPLRFAVLVGELQRCGLTADAGLLLWEAAALPAGPFAAAAAALSGLGHGEEAGRMLRQGVSRPPHELAEAALALHRTGCTREAIWLLAAVIRARTPAGAAQVARAEPPVLVGLVLQAARALSREQCLRVADALRNAEVPGVPEAL
ncbi:hypothetical protein [Streptomyces sp. Amel2xB2]|uniref:hypothetical protein n=1 Tax=Streptomyces sp. Amel2xB2 TaxID=1305829 RepID=UPI0011B9383C|nr:hypothetical protein [Streptomyces sp. Amel2xB2]